MEEQKRTAQAPLYHVKIIHSSATDIYGWDESPGLQPGDPVVVPTRYGLELGRIQGPVRAGWGENKDQQQIQRKATREDLERYELYKSREEGVFQTCKEKIDEHGLDMKLVSAHYSIDEKKILFYFTAENRVDFRQLVKDLVSIFNTRIELRQIGVRDEARVLGGMGVCGRTFCCHGVTDKLRAVSIKMAKEQNLTLNSMKISGPCGRLLCCLAYECDSYREIRRALPSEGTRIRSGEGTLRLVNVNICSQQAKLEAEDGTAVFLPFESFFYDSMREQWRIQES